MTTHRNPNELTLTELIAALPPLSGRARVAIVDCSRALLVHADGRPGEVYRDSEDDWSYRIAGDDEHVDESAWIDRTERFAEALGLTWTITDADGETVEVGIGDRLEPGSAIAGDYDRGRVLALSGGRVKIAWEGANEATWIDLSTVEGWHVHSPGPFGRVAWVHDWPAIEEVG